MGDESTTNENTTSGPDAWTVGAAVVGGAAGLFVAGPAGAIVGATGSAAVVEGVRKFQSSEDNKPSDQ